MFHVRLPYSNLQFNAVETLLRATYNGQYYCTNCPREQVEPEQDEQPEQEEAAAIEGTTEIMVTDYTFVTGSPANEMMTTEVRDIIVLRKLLSAII